MDPDPDLRLVGARLVGDGKGPEWTESRAPHDGAVGDVETGTVDRTLDDTAFEMSPGQRKRRMGAQILDGVVAPLDVADEELESGCVDDLHATGLQIRNIDDPIFSGVFHPVHPSAESFEAR